MKTLRKTLLLIHAVAAFSLAGANAARADVVVRIDNKLNPSNYSHAASADQIEVCIYTVGISNPYQYASEGWRCSTIVMNTVSENYWSVGWGGVGDLDAGQVTKVHFRTNGSDLFIIDQWQLVDWDGFFSTLTQGVDNEYGWCLSTDSLDFANSHCGSVNGSGITWTFPIRPLVI